MKKLIPIAILFSSVTYASNFMQRYIDETNQLEQQRLVKSNKKTEEIKKERKALEAELKKLQKKEVNLKRKKQSLQQKQKKLMRISKDLKADLLELLTSFEKQKGLLNTIWMSGEIGFFYPDLKARFQKLQKENLNSDSIQELLYLSEKSIEISKSYKQKDLEFFDDNNEKIEAKGWHVGLLSYFTDNFYLRYSNKIDALTVWPRLSSLEDATTMTSSEQIKALSFDLSSGSLYKYLKNYPSLYDQWLYGGIVLKIIAFLFIMSLLLMTLKYSYISRFRKSLIDDNDFHKALEALGERNMDNIDSANSFDTFMNKVDCDLHRNLSLIKVFASICPLLGLLGTITGMIETFQGLSMANAQSSTMMAAGISKALITTVGGLIAAIPLLIAHNILFQYATASVQKAEDTFNLKR